MPFIAYDENGQPKQFCCLKVNDKWKIHHFEDGIWKRLYTGLPDDATECSPTAEWTIDGWRVSFIGGGFDENINSAGFFNLFRKNKKTCVSHVFYR